MELVTVEQDVENGTGDLDSPKPKTGNARYTEIFEATIRPALVECFGTILLVYAMCMADCTAGGWAPLLEGFALFALMASIGIISGGHFNPVVTLCFVQAWGIRPSLALVYFIMQMVGATIGAALVRVSIKDSIYQNCSGGASILADGVDTGQAYLVEFMVVIFFISVVLMTTIDSQGKSVLAPLAIGFTFSLCVMVSASITGSSINPAKSFGAGVVANVWTGDQWIYWIGPLSGSSAAIGLYVTVFAGRDRRWGTKLTTTY